jgi:hypothetical protein
MPMPQPASDSAKHLTRAIKDCTNAMQLRRLLDGHLAEMNHIHVSAMTTHLAQLTAAADKCGARLEGAPELMDRLLKAVMQRLGAYEPRQLANTLWAVAKTGCRPPAEWLRRILVAYEPHWQDFEPQHLSNSVYALAIMRYDPGGAWLARLMQVRACMRVTGGGSSKSHAARRPALGTWCSCRRSL